MTWSTCRGRWPLQVDQAICSFSVVLVEILLLLRYCEVLEICVSGMCFDNSFFARRIPFGGCLAKNKSDASIVVFSACIAHHEVRRTGGGRVVYYCVFVCFLMLFSRSRYNVTTSPKLQCFLKISLFCPDYFMNVCRLCTFLWIVLDASVLIAFLPLFGVVSCFLLCFGGVSAPLLLVVTS